MKYIIKLHARKRMRERGIPEKILKEALDNPSNVSYDSRGRALIKKLYRRNGKERLLFVVGELAGDIMEIITIVDTSKVRKYL